MATNSQKWGDNVKPPCSLRSWVTPRIAERSVDLEMLSVDFEEQEREDKDGEEAEGEEFVNPLVGLKVKEIVEPLVKLVRYDSSIPNALDSILPRYILCCV